MYIFLKSFLSVFFVSIILSFFITNTSLANNYSLDVFASKAGYTSAAAKAPLETTIQVVINVVLSLTSVLFLVLAVYAGVRWMTAQGNAENVTKAKDTLQAAVIGMVVVAMSYAVTTFIFKALPQVVPTSPPAGTKPPAPKPKNCTEASGPKKTEADCKAIDSTCEWDVDLNICSTAIVCKADTDCISGFCNTDGKCINCSKANNTSSNGCKLIDESCVYDESTKVCSKIIVNNCSDNTYMCGGACPKKCGMMLKCTQTSDCIVGLKCEDASKKCFATPANFCWDRGYVWVDQYTKCITSDGWKDCNAAYLDCGKNSGSNCLDQRKNCYYNNLVNPQNPT